MTQEEKQLLLKDLCARLPYGICANLPNHHLVSHKYVIYDINIQNGWTTGLLDCAGRIQIYSAKVEDLKPYLHPMSSMTEEEREELRQEQIKDEQLFTDCIKNHPEMRGLIIPHFAANWCDRNMFDYRGLIEKGLALEAPEGMYERIEEKSIRKGYGMV